MKILLKYLFLVFFVSCTAINDIHQQQPSINRRSQIVSFEEASILANALYRGNTARTRAELTELPSITPLVDMYQDTLFYYADFHPGWILISSDKRTPIILAENDSSCFIDCIADNEAAAEWLDLMADDIRYVKTNPNWVFSDTENDPSSFTDIWAKITPTGTKSMAGHYELYESTNYPDNPVIINHLTDTKWRQGTPYNNYCPYKSDGSGERVPAGCVAIAGAQMLYYLHNKIGRPVSSPSSGYCYGQVGNYTQHFTDFTATSIQNANTVSDYAALLIGFVGMTVGMDYGNTGSSASTSDLVEDVFEPFGIGCEYTSYNQTKIRSSLLDSIPVIVRADGKKKTILGIPTYSHGHSFIIDGFRSERNKVINKYVWCDYIQNPDSLDTYLPIYDFSNYYYDTVYTSPTISMIKMNWGWGNSASYNTWYTPTGNWHTTETDPELDFDYNRNIIYNFHTL